MCLKVYNPASPINIPIRNMLFFSAALIASLAAASSFSSSASTNNAKNAFIIFGNTEIPHQEYLSHCTEKGLQPANLERIDSGLLKELKPYEGKSAWVGSIQGRDFGGLPIILSPKGTVTVFLTTNDKTEAFEHLPLGQNALKSSPLVHHNEHSSEPIEEFTIPTASGQNQTKDDNEVEDVLKSIDETIPPRKSAKGRVVVSTYTSDDENSQEPSDESESDSDKSEQESDSDSESSEPEKSKKSKKSKTAAKSKKGKKDVRSSSKSKAPATSKNLPVAEKSLSKSKAPAKAISKELPVAGNGNKANQPRPKSKENIAVTTQQQGQQPSSPPPLPQTPTPSKSAAASTSTSTTSPAPYHQLASVAPIQASALGVPTSKPTGIDWADESSTHDDAENEAEEVEETEGNTEEAEEIEENSE